MRWLLSTNGAGAPLGWSVGQKMRDSPMCGEKRCLAHAASQKGVSSTEMLILWLPDAIFRSDIYISTDQQPRLDIVLRASL